MLGAKGFAYDVMSDEAGSESDQRGWQQYLRRAEAPVTVVLDSRVPDLSYVSTLNHLCDVVCIDDEQYRDFDCRLVVNPNPWARPERYGAQSGRTVLAGPAYALVDRAFLDGRRARSSVGDVPVVAITMGGEDPDNVTAHTLAAMASLTRPLHVKVIQGPAFLGQRRVRALAEASPHQVTVVEGCTDLAPLIPDIDIAICSASTTSYELATAGVAMIVVALADHQIPVARYFRDTGSAVTVGRGDSFTSDWSALSPAVSRLVEDGDARQAMLARIRQLFDGRGAFHVSMTILGHEHATAGLVASRD